MKNILVATPVRGFWKDLFDTDNSEINFMYEDATHYEVPKKWKEILAGVVASRILDFTGIFQVRNYDQNIESDYAFSYNRFLYSNRPYVIALENPTALVNYSFKRMYHCLTKKRLFKLFNNSHLKTIICISKACKNSIRNYYDIPDTVNIEQIYPLINSQIDYSDDNIKKIITNKHSNNKLKCIYVSAYFGLKGGMDIVFAMENLKKYNIYLTIVTKIGTIENKYLEMIKENKNIELLDYNLPKDKLYNMFLNSNILINPTRKDSFSLVTLEAGKHGCAILSTDNYALKEMVIDGYNGFKVSPKYSYWTEDNMPNLDVVYRQKKTIDSGYVDSNVVSFLENKILKLYDDNELLIELEKNSLKYFNEGDFNNDYIIQKWNSIFK